MRLPSQPSDGKKKTGETNKKPLFVYNFKGNAVCKTFYCSAFGV